MSSNPRPRVPLNLSIRDIGFGSKPQIDIIIDGEEQNPSRYIRSYSTLDQITGKVVISPKNDTAFGTLDISFVGATKTFVDKMTTVSGMQGRTEATHRFLRLHQPVRDDEMPADRVLRKGETYRVPFTFVVPPQLLPKACVHGVDNEQVRHAHLQLPPSMGDPELSGYGPHLLDDMAPAMVKINYNIRVKLSKTRDDGVETTLAEAWKKLRIKPAYDEQPPMTIDVRTGEYNLQEEKTLRKGFMKGKLGRLVVETAQPKSFRLPALGPHDAIPPITTMARMKLRFEPHDDSCKPPKLGQLNSKIKITTFFSSIPRHALPCRATTLADTAQGYISETMPLSSMCVAAVEWTKHGASSRSSSPGRRDSVASTVSEASVDLSDSSTSSPINTDGQPYYTASIIIPLAMPKGKNFLPTFHSCIASRTYSLSFNLSLGKPSNTTLLSSSISLKVPVQISSEGSVESSERRRLSEVQNLAFMEAEEVFVPRSTAPTSPGASPTQISDLPPSYGGIEFHRGGGSNRGISMAVGGVSFPGENGIDRMDR